MFRKMRSHKGSREIEKNEMEIALTLYIEIPVYQWIERCRELLRIKIFQKELSRGVYSKMTSMDRGAIKNLSSKQKLSRWIENLSRSYQDVRTYVIHLLGTYVTILCN